MRFLHAPAGICLFLLQAPIHAKMEEKNQDMTFLPDGGNYRKLVAYQKAECIYDITYYFAHKFLAKGDRTIDQMVQAARSGKQNIAEGSAAAATSTKTEIKLTNVAKAGLQELLTDYEDYLKGARTGTMGRHTKTLVPSKRAGCAAIIAIRLSIGQPSPCAPMKPLPISPLPLSTLLAKLLRHQQDRFIKQGGIKELMFRARNEFRAGK